jgi:hypothetical protein
MLKEALGHIPKTWGTFTCSIHCAFAHNFLANFEVLTNGIAIKFQLHVLQTLWRAICWFCKRTEYFFWEAKLCVFMYLA